MKQYTLEEVNELKEWFESHELPASVQADKSTYVPDVQKTVNALIRQSLITYKNPKMQSYISLLEKIKTACENNKIDK